MKRFSATLYLAVALTSTALATVQPASFPETETAWLTGTLQAEPMPDAVPNRPATQTEPQRRTD